MYEVLWPFNTSNRLKEKRGTLSDWKLCCEQTIPYFYYGRKENETYWIDTMQGSDKSVFHKAGDELYTSARVDLFSHPGSVSFITHTKEQYRPLSRDMWKYCPRKLSQGYYSAAHLLRPYSRYRQAVDYLIQGRAMPLWYRICFRLTEAGLLPYRHFRKWGGTKLSLILLLPWLIIFTITHWLSGRWEIALLKNYALQRCIKMCTRDKTLRIFWQLLCLLRQQSRPGKK